MKKTLQLFACIIVSICIYTISCFSQSTKRYDNEDKNYSIEFPQSWVFSYDKNALVSALSACDSLDSNNLLIITTGATGALTLNEAMKITKRNMGIGKKNPIDSQGDDIINGMNTKWCVFDINTNAGSRKIKMYLFKKGSRQYTIQAKLIPNEFETKIKVFEEVISTFKIHN